MTDPAHTTEGHAATEPDEAVYELASGRLEHDVVEALAAGDGARVKDLIAPLHYADVADLLEHLSAEERH
ncbi:MAG: magnesium transporter, partial [Alphaproteobacteria bacterium]|nr:magnesium transporter [Alphaproteobacteria bacterium]